MASSPSQTPAPTSITNVMSNNKLLVLLLTVIVISGGALMLYGSSNVLRWIQRKRYQYEVTFSLYMLTPTEKFIFNSILFLFLAMVSIAAALYLPGHIATMTRRAYWYVLGDAEALNASLREPPTVGQIVQGVKDGLVGQLSSHDPGTTAQAARVVGESVVGEL